MASMKTMIPPLRFVLLLPLALLLFSSCTRETQVSVGGGSIPVFAVKGTARLTSFKVLRPKAGTDGNAVEAVWQVVPLESAGGSRSLDTLQSVQYGVVPDGYSQNVPDKGHPPSLTDGVTYQAEIETGNPPSLHLRFAIRNGQAVNIGAGSNLRNIPTH